MDVEGELENLSSQTWTHYHGISTGMKVRIRWVSGSWEQVSRLTTWLRKGYFEGTYTMCFWSSCIYYSFFFFLPFLHCYFLLYNPIPFMKLG